MRIVLLIAVAAAVGAVIGLERVSASGVSKTYGLSVAVKDGICRATQTAGVSPKVFAVLICPS
jgi:hypothetical protein